VEDASGSGRIETLHPATGEVITEFADGTAEDVDRAVAAARARVQRPFVAPDGRGGPRRRTLADGRHHRTAWLGPGPPRVAGQWQAVREAQIDIRQAVDAFRYYAGWATKLQGDTLPVRGNMLNYTLREPIGVVGAIIPWNFPLLMAVWKVAPALACGNTIVLKPAEQTPLSALELAAIARRGRHSRRRPERGARLWRDGRRRAGAAWGTWTRSRSPAPPPSAASSCGRPPAR
jgi:aldehyde dehydrogenase (NAD+)